MKVTIHTTDGVGVKIKQFDPDSLLAFIEAIETVPADDMVHFDLDDGAAQVYIQKRHIVRVDVDQQDPQ